MAELKTDGQLLREYAGSGCESAFQQLVERHLDLVFGTALRGLNDPAAAQEITQNVFITLARKAAWLGGETSLAGWLHKTALLEIRRWWRGELRRQRREQTAVELGTTMKDEDGLLKALAGELDEGLLHLRESDRQALMLRYYERRSHREIGALLGAREDAVRMRIDKALDRLTRFFRRRGYAVPAIATTVAVLSASAKAAPAGLAAITARSALAAAGGGAATGLKLFALKLAGLTKAQTAVLLVVLAAAPVIWEWNVNRMASKQVARAQSQLAATRDQQTHASTELDQLRTESARLDAALAETLKARARYDAAAAKLEDLKARLAGLLADANPRWPDDLPFVRIPKRVVRSLDLLHRPPMAFSSSGALSEPAIELFGITAQEQGPAEQALARYWRGVEDLMAANAYETNHPLTQTGRLTKTVIIPPLGQPLKTLAEDTRAQLTDILGADREQLLFGEWDQGAIQLFSPGTPWKISEEPQTLTVWVEPEGDNKPPRFGASRDSTKGGTSAVGLHSLGLLPKAIAARFFDPWLIQMGISKEASNE